MFVLLRAGQSNARIPEVGKAVADDIVDVAVAVVVGVEAAAAEGLGVRVSEVVVAGLPDIE